MKCAAALVLFAASRPVSVRAAVRLPAPRLRGGAPRLQAAVFGTDDADYYPDPSDEEENSEDGGGGERRPAVAAR